MRDLASNIGRSVSSLFMIKLAFPHSAESFARGFGRRQKLREGEQAGNAQLPNSFPQILTTNHSMSGF